MYISADAARRLQAYHHRELASQLTELEQIDPRQLIDLYLFERYRELLLDHESAVLAFAHLWQEIDSEKHIRPVLALICSDAADFARCIEELQHVTGEQLERLTAQQEAESFIQQYGPVTPMIYRLSSV